MGLVASAKIRGATKAMQKSREYYGAMEETIGMLTSSKACEKSEYMKRNENGKILLIVIAGDRGLAGGYNSNVFKMAEGIKADKIIAIGKRSCDRYSGALIKAETFTYDDAIKISKTLCDEFKNGEYERIGIVSTKYVSMLTQTPQTQWILPLSKGEKKSRGDMLFEPDEKTVLESIIEEYVASCIISSVRESFTSEVVARRFAMDSAGKNAGEMIESLRLEYNRARQGAITQEITEIVAGSGI